MRYKCIVSYDGSNFCGFQTQLNLRTVQEELENIISLVTKETIKIYASSRTDSKVHAIGQTFHFDTSLDIEPFKIQNAINTRLANDIYISEVYKVDESFHARFSSIKKEYHYLVSRTTYSPFKRNYYFQTRNQNYDIDLMIEASKIFIGEKDFKSFTKSKKTTTTIRTIYSIDFEVSKEVLKIKFIGNGFLHNMVRILVAMLFEVGYKKISIQELKEIQNLKNRQYAPKIAPANGLYLYKVYYENI